MEGGGIALLGKAQEGLLHEIGHYLQIAKTLRQIGLERAPMRGEKPFEILADQFAASLLAGPKTG